MTYTFATPTEDEFAALVADRIRKAGEKQKLLYDKKSFQLTSEEEKPQVVNLQNLYEEYCSYGKEKRSDALKRFVRLWFAMDMANVPKEYADARHDLLPSVRSRSRHAFETLQSQIDGRPARDALYQVFAEHLAISLVFDLPEAMVDLGHSDLTDWGVSFDEALQAAMANLRAISDRRFGMPRPGVWASPYQDNYDPARMLLYDLVREHPVKGDPIAMLPNRDTLLITGSQDLTGLENLLALAENGRTHPRYITGLAFRLVGDTWQPYLPAPDHALYEKFRLSSLRSIGGNYEDQKEMLDDLHEKTGQDIFVASFMGTKTDSGNHLSCSVWSKGVDTLLPRTDLVGFFISTDDLGVEPVAWERVILTVGDLIEPQGMYPERYRVRSFPTDDQLKTLNTDNVPCKEATCQESRN